MKGHSLLKTLALSASLLIPLSGCGVEEPHEDAAAPREQVPPEELPAAPEQSDPGELAASEQTRAALGIHTWRVLEPVDDRARVEGVDALGRVLLSAISTPTEEGYILDVTAPAPMSFRVDADFRLLEGDASQPIFAALHKDLMSPPVNPQANPPLDISDFDLTRAGPETLADDSGQVRAFATDAQRAEYRRRLTCHLRYANESYLSADGRPSVCGLYYRRARSNNVTKVWTAEDPEDQTHFITIAFAGSHNVGDWLRDIESQAYKTHQSPFTSTVPYAPMSVGLGWEVRWNNQAKDQTINLAAFLNSAVTTNLQRGWKMQLVVTGHSLGAVTATLAGFDIAGMLAQRGVLHRVAVTAFNPPRLGYSSARTEYQKRLFATCNVGEYGRNLPCLILRQMTRGYDVVHTLPLNMTHPVWQTANNANRGVGPGPYGSNATLPYCPQYHAPAVSVFDPYGNHDRFRWGTDIANMPNNHLDCMYLPN